MNSIKIEREAIYFGENKISPPILQDDLKLIFGNPRKYEHNIENYNKSIYVWDELGISAYFNEETKEYDTIVIAKEENDKLFPREYFRGNIWIGNKQYTECKWNKKNLLSVNCKFGNFEMVTFLEEMIPEMPEQDRELARTACAKIEINIIKQKKSKYRLEHKNMEEIEFDNFNFKLAVIQELMYNQKLLLPQFQITEFVKEYDKRKIDLLEEGFEPIDEVVEWFRRLQIPTAMADEITEICMDGGDEIYHQIIPFWDGEDDYFDLSDISRDEIRQFHNLKKMTIMSNNYSDVANILKENNIEVDSLV